MPKLSIPHIRLINQQLISTNFKTTKEIVSWLGAVQAQEYNMAKWAIGTRLPNITDKQVEEDLCKGEIIRTHILRPTWHFVTKEDIHWMLQLTAPRIKQALNGYNKYTELEALTIKKVTPVIVKLLSGSNHLTKQEIGEHLQAKKVDITTHQLSHILFHAEVDGVICNGAVKGKKQTYSLLEELIPRPKKFDKDEALGMLARRFFTSHAPATLQDFTWWSGLTLTEAKKALEMVKSDFVSEEIDGQTYWFSNSFKGLTVDKNIAHLLPAFDEYVVSYKDRKEIFEHGYYLEVIGKNGLFKPTVMVNGQVAGMWKRVVKGKKATVELQLFKKFSKEVKSAIANEVEKYEKFVAGK